MTSAWLASTRAVGPNTLLRSPEELEWTRATGQVSQGGHAVGHRANDYDVDERRPSTFV